MVSAANGLVVPCMVVAAGLSTVPYELASVATYLRSPRAHDALTLHEPPGSVYIEPLEGGRIRRNGLTPVLGNLPHRRCRLGGARDRMGVRWRRAVFGGHSPYTRERSIMTAMAGRKCMENRAN